MIKYIKCSDSFGELQPRPETTNVTADMLTLLMHRLHAAPLTLPLRVFTSLLEHSQLGP